MSEPTIDPNQLQRRLEEARSAFDQAINLKHRTSEEIKSRAI